MGVDVIDALRVDALTLELPKSNEEEMDIISDAIPIGYAPRRKQSIVDLVMEKFYPDELSTGHYQHEHLDYHNQPHRTVTEEVSSASVPYGELMTDYDRVSHGMEMMTVNAPHSYYASYPPQHQHLPQQPLVAAQTSPKYVRESQPESIISSTAETEEKGLTDQTTQPTKEKKKKSKGSGKKKGSRCKVDSEPEEVPKKRRKSVATVPVLNLEENEKGKLKGRSLIRQRRASLPALSPDSIQKKINTNDAMFNISNGVGVIFYPEAAPSEDDRNTVNMGTPTASPINEDNSSEDSGVEQFTYTKLKEPQIKVTRSGKRRLKWTSELSDLFAKAVEKLGPGAVPSAILEEMGVQGLTRGNISSHLQKYRLEARQKQLQKQAEEEQQLQQQHLLQLQFQHQMQHERVVKMVYPPLANQPPASPSALNGSTNSNGRTRNSGTYEMQDEYGAEGDLHLYLNSIGSLDQQQQRGSSTTPNVDLLFSSGGSNPVLSTTSYSLTQSGSGVPPSPSSKTAHPYHSASPYVWMDHSSPVSVDHYDRAYGGGYHSTTPYHSVPYYCYGCSCSMPSTHNAACSSGQPTNFCSNTPESSSATSSGLDGSNPDNHNNNSSISAAAASNAGITGGVEN
jgi:SHAQKYF class myb-like DNA-binding protein